jgi:hypothetical protein
MNHRLLRLLFVLVLAAQVGQHAAWAQVKAAPSIPGVKGKLQAVTSGSLDVLSPSGVVHVKIEHPFRTYGRVPSDLSHVTSTSFVGVTSVKQADGTELAKEIHIFPAELRGAGEGSNMIAGAPGSSASQSRMTNGSVSRPIGAVSGSRMTNGTVQRQGGGTTLVVRYQEGAQTVSVPKNVEVTEIVPMKEKLMPGDTVYVATEKQSDGTLTTNKVYLIAGSSNAK